MTFNDDEIMNNSYEINWRKRFIIKCSQVDFIL